MRPREQKRGGQDSLFRDRLENILNRKHELFRLAGIIDWSSLEQQFGQYYSENGRPGIPIRLMVGLTYLEHAFGFSDEEVVAKWVENPYWQYFCGEHYFQHELPIDPSSLSRWRKRIGENGAEAILAATIQAGVASKAVKESSFERITVDTTVQPKAITYPTDARLYNHAREILVRLCRDTGIQLRQSYARIGPRTAMMAARYFHARQTKRGKRAVKKLKTMLGRVYRDVERKIADNPMAPKMFAHTMNLVDRLLHQERHDKEKLYSLWAPEVECISKGKSHRKYEFGVKVSVATTNRDNFVVGMQAIHGNPFDGHTLQQALMQVERVTNQKPERCYVDRGYRGNSVNEVAVFISGRKRGVTPTIKKELRRRSAIEPVIGHMKEDGKLGRNYLRDRLGDKINALLCGGGHNLRIILRKLREFLSLLDRSFWSTLWEILHGDLLGSPDVMPVAGK